MLLRIVRLQIQLSPLKQGDKPYRWYDPSKIRQVDRLRINDDGALGDVDGERGIVDVHHVSHPDSRNHGRVSGLSIGFTSHYRAMRDMFGAHVTDGIAGENVLVDVERPIAVDDFAGATLQTSDGRVVRLDDVRAAEPCVEFSRFVLQVRPGEAGAAMREPLQQLRDGMRGFYVALGEPVDLTVGDWLDLAP